METGGRIGPSNRFVGGEHDQEQGGEEAAPDVHPVQHGGNPELKPRTNKTERNVGRQSGGSKENMT